MKKYFYFTAALLSLVSCTNDEYFGNSSVDSTGILTFNLETPNMTRAGGKDAATALNNQFIVWGEKNEGTDGNAPTTGNLVLENYTVNWIDNSANTTESNSVGWEYVAQTAYDAAKVSPSIQSNTSLSTSQTIKYWDFGASKYTFTAISAKPSDIADGKVVIAKVTDASSSTATNKQYEKGYTVTVKSGASVGDIYFADRKEVTPSSSATCVQMTFRNFMSKIRFGIYETIPGYKVKVKKVYYNSDAAHTDNFGVDGAFLTAGATDMQFNVTYHESGTQQNQVKVALASGSNTSSYLEVASSKILAAANLGTASNSATLEDYITTLPYSSNTTNMKLKVDYTLTSEDTGETIEVTGATAEVPSIYCQWQSNFAYTYLFKISDNTNGQTGTVAGLYPMTFDAVVETDATTGVQETITSVSDPSITTYQSGVVVTANNEYTAGTIYFTNKDMSVADYKVYEVHNAGTETTTEEVVANWQNNFVTLTEVTATDCGTNGIPLSDGSKIATTANQAKYFTAAAGKVYAIATGDASTTTTKYKVVKVTGSETAPTYTLTAPTTAKITTAAGSLTYVLKSNSPTSDAAVLGAAKVIKVLNSSNQDVTSKFTITANATAGSYDITLSTSSAAEANINGTYTVQFGSITASLEVALTYTLAATTASITTADGKAVITLKAATDVPVTGAETSIKIYDAASDGTEVTKFTISAGSTAGEYYVSYTTAPTSTDNGTYYVDFGSATRVSFTTNVTVTP